MSTASPRDVIAKAVEAYNNLSSGLKPGLFDFTSYPGNAPPHVVRDETNRVVFRSTDGDEAEERWKAECRRMLGDTVLSALTAAGWTLAPPGSRVVPEGGVDRETVLKCIALIEQSWKPVGAGDGQTFVVGCGGGTAALRALAEAKP